MNSATGRDVVIRPLQPEDAEAFRYLNEEWITRYFRLEEKDRKILGDTQAILGSGGRIVMAISDNVAVGTCALLPMEDGSFEVSKMAVTESHQGRGIGRLLLRAVIQEARAMGARRLYLETNNTLHPAIRLYESVGFRHIPPERITPSPYQRADVYMELLLDEERDVTL